MKAINNSAAGGSLVNIIFGYITDSRADHSNGNFVAVYPPHIGKEKAVRWFIDNIVPEGAITIGMGDSLTDGPFMAECDYIFMPNRTQNSAAFIEAIKLAER